jgi:ElaB/YqjD/DUF883 family membrane-anchored ribosome-binding protein
MGNDSQDKIDEIASDLEDLKVDVEELAIEPTADATADGLNKVKSALEQAIDATDAMEEQREEPTL